MKRSWFIVLGGAVLLLSVVLEPHGPYRMGLPGGAALPETSPFHLATGFPGPTCGLTRSFVNTAHLKLGDAFHSHLLGPLLFVGLLVSWAWVASWTVVESWGKSARGRSKERRRWPGALHGAPERPGHLRRYIRPLTLIGSAALLSAWAAKILLGWY